MAQKIPNLCFPPVTTGPSTAAGYAASFFAAVLARFFSLCAVQHVKNTMIMPKKSVTKLASSSQMPEPK